MLKKGLNRVNPIKMKNTRYERRVENTAIENAFLEDGPARSREMRYLARNHMDQR